MTHGSDWLDRAKTWDRLADEAIQLYERGYGSSADIVACQDQAQKCRERAKCLIDPELAANMIGGLL